MTRSSQRPVLGIDIGGTKLAVGVVTRDGRVHGRVEEPTRRDDGPTVILERLWQLGRRSIDATAAQLDPVVAVGIACGGPLDSTRGVLVHPLHLPGWRDIPVVDLASTEFGVDARLENDASAAALGEYRFGHGRECDTMLYLTLSTGVGGGLLLGGRLHRGATGNGGEFGHITVRNPGRDCACGRTGCLEAYASGTSIAVRATEALLAGQRSSLEMLAAITAQDVVDAAADGDPLAAQLWTETTDLIGRALTDVINALEPDLVVLGGGVTRAGEALLAPVRAVVAREAMTPARAATPIERSALGDDVGIVGAAATAFELMSATA